MCGIIGVWVKDPKNVRDNILRILRHQQDRGLDGGGMSILRNGKLNRLKVHNPYTMFYQDNIKWWEDIRVGDCIILHHRFPTTGGGGRVLNANHPLANENNSIHLIHNGGIYNDWELFGKLSNKHSFESITNKGITDSEIFVHLLEDKTKLKTQMDFIEEEVSGNYALAWFYEDKKEINLYRHSNPIVYYKDRDNNMYFSSEFPRNRGFRCKADLLEGFIYKITENGLVKKYKIDKKISYYKTNSYQECKNIPFSCKSDVYEYDSYDDLWVSTNGIYLFNEEIINHKYLDKSKKYTYTSTGYFELYEEDEEEEADLIESVVSTLVTENDYGSGIR